MKIEEYIADKRAEVETALKRLMLQEHEPFADHIRAMRYSLFVGGKRIRPILCLAACEAITDNQQTYQALLPIACALECIHTYSLIHDDLPAMDNDDLRRGKPTNHKLFGEAAAILAGDGLLTFAFELLAAPNEAVTPQRRLRMIEAIASSSGPTGMVGGQALDIANEHKKIPFELLQTIHRSKTGALIACAVQVGAIGAGATPQQEQDLTEYGTAIGLAFQIVDDLLDATATTDELGKTAGSDAARGKATYPGFFGIEATRSLAQEAIGQAKHALASFDQRCQPLRMLADYMYARTY